MNLPRFIYVIGILLLTCHSTDAAEPEYGTGYETLSSCTDRNYVDYIDTRLAFYKKLDSQSYEKTKTQHLTPSAISKSISIYSQIQSIALALIVKILR